MKKRFATLAQGVADVYELLPSPFKEGIGQEVFRKDFKHDRLERLVRRFMRYAFRHQSTFKKTRTNVQVDVGANYVSFEMLTTQGNFTLWVESKSRRHPLTGPYLFIIDCWQDDETEEACRLWQLKCAKLGWRISHDYVIKDDTHYGFYVYSDGPCWAEANV